MFNKRFSDFRSDTVTQPTMEMRHAMFNAEVGDEVLGEDPTVIRLEELAATITGKESALFVPSGTMGNTITMKLAVGEGHVVIMDDRSHILHYEGGNLSKIAFCMARPLPSDHGKIPLDLIEENILINPRDIDGEHESFSTEKKRKTWGRDIMESRYLPETRAISLENTHNTSGGSVLEPEYIEKVSELARKYHLHFHMDGARIFNAAIALGVDVKEITKHCDSVMFCLSKGLAAPMGSMLVGEKGFIKEARILRKSLGGGMRQIGFMAAAGIVGLETMVNRLEEDHRRAKMLVERMMDIKNITVDPSEVVTNIIMVKLANMGSVDFVARMAAQDVLVLPFGKDRIRMVTHKDIDDSDIDRGILAIRNAVA